MTKKKLLGLNVTRIGFANWLTSLPPARPIGRANGKNHPLFKFLETSLPPTEKIVSLSYSLYSISVDGHSKYYVSATIRKRTNVPKTKGYYCFKEVVTHWAMPPWLYDFTLKLDALPAGKIVSVKQALLMLNSK